MPCRPGGTTYWLSSSLSLWRQQLSGVKLSCLPLMAVTLNDCIKTLCPDNSTLYMQPFSSAAFYSSHSPGSMLLHMLLTTAWWSSIMLLCTGMVPKLSYSKTCLQCNPAQDQQSFSSHSPGPGCCKCS